MFDEMRIRIRSNTYYFGLQDIFSVFPFTFILFKDLGWGKGYYILSKKKNILLVKNTILIKKIAIYKSSQITILIEKIPFLPNTFPGTMAI